MTRSIHTPSAAIRIGISCLVIGMLPVLAACSAEPTTVDTEVSTGTEADEAPTEPTETDAEERDVCALLTGVDTTALVGVEMGDGVNQGDTCVVEPADSASSGSLRAVWLTSGGAARYEQQRTLLGVSSEVAAFGDEAFLTGTWLLALRGDEFLSLQVIPDPLAPGPRITDDQVIAAATTVAANAGW